LNPIVLDAEGRILDGRNRLAACKLARVKPTFTTYEGDDPSTYALVVNIARRHMSKGSMAMVAAKAARLAGLKPTNHKHPESGKRIEDVGKPVGVERSYVGRAFFVIENAPDLVDPVIAGASLNEAYALAQQIKRDKDDAEEQERTAEERAKAKAKKDAARIEALKKQLTKTVEAIGPAVPLAKLPAPVVSGVEVERGRGAITTTQRPFAPSGRGLDRPARRWSLLGCAGWGLQRWWHTLLERPALSCLGCRRLGSRVGRHRDQPRPECCASG
jgi:hypothetical protein